MIKVLHISKYYYPYAGGIEDVCYNIVSSLGSLPIEQKVICFNSSRSTNSVHYEGVEIIRIGQFFKLASQSLSLKYKSELRKILKSFQPNIVHFHAPNPLVAYYLIPLLSKQTKLIVHWHSDIIAQKFLYRFIKPVETRLLKRADVIIATSPNYVKCSIPLQPFKDKIVVIPNTINPHKFAFTSRVESKVKLLKAFYNYKPILLFIGRHVPYKGLEYLIDACLRLHQECEVIIGGSGPLTTELKRRCQKTNIHFVGRIPDDELAAYYYAADIFLFPSITKNEAFGVVLAEAMYCYTPAITFKIEGSGVNWVNIHDETGMEVENSNSYKLACAIDKLLSDSITRKKYAQQARQRVEKLFTIEKVATQIKQLYGCYE